jgi:hypothetical protein
MFESKEDHRDQLKHVEGILLTVKSLKLDLLIKNNSTKQSIQWSSYTEIFFVFRRKMEPPTTKHRRNARVMDT